MVSSKVMAWRKYLAGGFSVVVLAATVPSALAYIAPSYFVVRQIAKKHSDLTGITIKNRITFMDRNGPRGTPFTETISLPSAEKAVIVLKNSSGQVAATVTRSLSSEGARGSTSLPMFLSYSSNMGGLFNSLRGVGIPVKTESQVYAEKDPSREHLPYKPEDTMSLGRADNRVFIVMNGDGGRSLSPPQLWVDKGSFLPSRVLFKPSSGGDTLDVTYESYSVHQGSFVPRRMDVARSNDPWVRVELLDVANGASAGPAGSGSVNENAGGLKDDVDLYLQWVR